MKVIAGVIYKAKRGHIYDTDTKENIKFNCYSPCMTGDFGIVDCWLCTEDGQIHPGYNCSGVPVNTDALGQVVGLMGSRGMGYREVRWHPLNFLPFFSYY